MLKAFAPAQKVLSAVGLVVEYHTDVERRLRLRQVLPPTIDPKDWTFILDELWPLTYGSFLSAVAERSGDLIQATEDIGEPMGMSFTRFERGTRSRFHWVCLSLYIDERL